MKKLIYITFLFFLNISIQAQANINMDSFEQSNPPPPSSFGADGPGAPIPASSIDTYVIYFVLIGVLLILLYRKKIFKLHISNKQPPVKDLLKE